MNRVHYVVAGGVTACSWLPMPKATRLRRTVSPGKVTCWACKKHLQRQKRWMESKHG